MRNATVRPRSFADDRHLSEKIGNPDVLILLTNTVSHKMVQSALCEVKQSDTKICRLHSALPAVEKSFDGAAQRKHAFSRGIIFIRNNAFAALEDWRVILNLPRKQSV